MISHQTLLRCHIICLNTAFIAKGEVRGGRKRERRGGREGGGGGHRSVPKRDNHSVQKAFQHLWLSTCFQARAKVEWVTMTKQRPLVSNAIRQLRRSHLWLKKKEKRKVLKTLKLFDREVKHFIISHNSLNYWRLRLQKMKRKNKRKSGERLHKMTKVAGALISVVQHWGYHKVGCSSLTYIIIIIIIILEQNLKNIHCTFRQVTVHGGQLCDSKSCFTIITEIQDREREKDCRHT